MNGKGFPVTIRRHLKITFLLVVVTSLVLATGVYAGHAIDGTDAKITNDNNNVDGGTPNPSFDAQNRQSNETTVSMSPVNANLLAVGANDYRMVTVTGDVWFGLYVSQDGGTTWFNTFVPGFPSDTSQAGLASPLLGLDAAGDPVVRFDSLGNLYAAGIGFNRNFDQPDRPLDTAVFVAKYNYTPGTPGGISTPNSAGDPPNFTYAGTTIVARGAVGFAVPGPFGFAGSFTDKEWMEIDLNSPASSACAGSVYVAYTSFHGVLGNSPIRFSRSTDGGATFGQSKGISTGGPDTTQYNQGADIAVAPNGRIYVAYEAVSASTGTSTIQLVRSNDCGRKWSQPVSVGAISEPQAPGVAFRTPTFAFVATDSSNPDIVYVAYQSFAGDYDIYVQRSIDGGTTWEAPVQVNEDPGARHQIFPTIEVSSDGAVHVAWYDFRNSTADSNDMLDVYYASSNTSGVPYPAFSHNVRVSDVSHAANCLLFGGGTAGFHGDYIELDAARVGASDLVYVAWADHRDVSPCDLDPAPGPASNNTGNRNENIYGSMLSVNP